VRLISSSNDKTEKFSNFKDAFLDGFEKEACVFGIENCFDTNSRYLVVHTIHKMETLYNLNHQDFLTQFQVLSSAESLICQDLLLFHHEHASISRFTSSAASLYDHHIHTTSQGMFDEYFAIDKRFELSKI
jgi:hypothetical protein